VDVVSAAVHHVDHLGGAMLVQRVLLPATRRESWTVLSDDGPVQPIERYLAYLTDIEHPCSAGCRLPPPATGN
jgi:hypothetical protein